MLIEQLCIAQYCNSCLYLERALDSLFFKFCSEHRNRMLIYRFSSQFFMGWSSFKFHSESEHWNMFVPNIFLAAGLTFFHLKHQTHASICTCQSNNVYFCTCSSNRNWINMTIFDSIDHSVSKQRLKPKIWLGDDLQTGLQDFGGKPIRFYQVIAEI